MKGQIFKIFSDFYYVKTDFGTIECKLKDILKKKSEDVFVGDFVELDSVTQNKSQAFISAVLPRKNYLSRPKVANISQAIIISALKNPNLDFEQLNRYVALCEYHNVKPVICFNKCDLVKDVDFIDYLKNIYEPIGYKLFFTSALLGDGVKLLASILEDNVSIFCGASGVGKSTMINLLSDGVLHLKTKNVSDKTKRGVHTTRHCEIYNLKENTSVVDTPGFSNAKFNFLLPKDVQNLFPEIKSLNNCRYSDCIHILENDCNVLSNIDKIHQTRYNSYSKFVEEAKEYKKKITFEGKKCESSSKFNKGIEFAKISDRKRALSRKTVNQNIVKKEVHND